MATEAVLGNRGAEFSCGCRMEFSADLKKVKLQHCALHGAAADLLKALKETREVAAACFRAMVDLGYVEEVIDRMPRGMEDSTQGFGQRAGEAIKKAEGKL